MTLLKDILDIPERMHDGDFVLKLAEGMAAGVAEKTVRDYVLTEQLETCLDQCLKLIEGAFKEGVSKADILHGSFGSGKSHMMAILGLLLQNHPAIRHSEKLHQLVTRKHPWVLGQRFLVVPFNLIGASTVEQAVFGQYTRFMATHYPDVPTPALSKAHDLFRDAQNMRARMGDEAFFAALNKADRGTAADAWSNLGDPWDAARFEVAVNSAPGQGDYADLVDVLVTSFFSAFGKGQMQGHDHYLGFETGLEVMSRHAKDAGFAGLVLFLDELILWLAGKAGNMNFVNHAIHTLSKLVETQNPRRPIPIVSFVARQRDLGELVGDHLPGVEHLRSEHLFRHWKGRFGLITLEDRNLTEIVAKRVLRPKPGGKQLLDEAFREFRQKHEDALKPLLVNKYSPKEFQQTYPFPPAFIEALVALSSSLQRERTSLKILYKILVDGRDYLKVGDIVPMGELYDAVSVGVNAFSARMDERFRDAKKLWEKKLKPMLMADHGIEPGRLDAADAVQRQGYENDALLAKTIVLAALAGDAEVFRQFTPAKLAAFNQGTIRSRVPGNITHKALTKVRKWGAQVGEIDISDDNNPVIKVKLSGVDTEAILKNVEGKDNHGARRNLFRDILFDMLGIDDQGSLIPGEVNQTFAWRGTDRQVQVVFANMRTLREDGYLHAGPTWKLIVDFPFDEVETVPERDLVKAKTFAAAHPDQYTLVWLPDFFSKQVIQNLGKLVLLEYLFKSADHFRRETPHLSDNDRLLARNILDSQRRALKQTLKNAILQAYGLETPERRPHLDPSSDFEPQVFSGFSGISVPNLGGAAMKEALEHILFKALSQQFPGHPDFEVSISKRHVADTWLYLQKAIYDKENRCHVPRGVIRQTLAGIINSLKLGFMGENSLVAKDDTWKNQLTRGLGGELEGKTVGEARKAIDFEKAHGLPNRLAHLIIAAVAAQEQLGFLDQDRMVPQAQVDSLALDDSFVLKSLDVPDKEAWDVVNTNASTMFGIPTGSVLNQAAMLHFQDRIQAHLASHAAAWEAWWQLLDQKGKPLGLSADAPRLKTAEAAVGLASRCRNAKPIEMIRYLAAFQPPTSLLAMRESMTSANRLLAAVNHASLEFIELCWQQAGDLAQGSGWGRSAFLDILAAEECNKRLEPALIKWRRAAIQFMKQSKPDPNPGPLPTVSDGNAKPQAQREKVQATQAEIPVAGAQGHTVHATGYADAKQKLEELKDKPGLEVRFQWTDS